MANLKDTNNNDNDPLSFGRLKASIEDLISGDRRRQRSTVDALVAQDVVFSHVLGVFYGREAFYHAYRVAGTVWRYKVRGSLGLCPNNAHNYRNTHPPVTSKTPQTPPKRLAGRVFSLQRRQHRRVSPRLGDPRAAYVPRPLPLSDGRPVAVCDARRRRRW
jgi:hypothetical protein